MYKNTYITIKLIVRFTMNLNTKTTKLNYLNVYRISIISYLDKANVGILYLHIYIIV